MSRKRLKAPTGIMLESGSAAAGSLRPFPVTREEISEVLERNPDRSVWLWDFAPYTIAEEVRRQVRTPVVLLVARMDTSSRVRDGQILGTLYRYAGYCFDRKGDFEPLRDLHEVEIRAYAQGIENSQTARLAMTTLRRVRRGTPFEVPRQRDTVLRPYSDDAWRRIWTSVHECSLPDALTVVVLCGRLAFHPGEAERADHDCIVRLSNGMRGVRAIESTGNLRLVPADTATLNLLDSFYAGHRGYLVRPKRTVRANAVNYVVQKARREVPELSDLDTRRLRHTAIANWLRAPIPYLSVCAAAGINASAHMITDIAILLDPPSDTATFEAFAQAGAMS